MRNILHFPKELLDAIRENRRVAEEAKKEEARRIAALRQLTQTTEWKILKSILQERIGMYTAELEALNLDPLHCAKKPVCAFVIAELRWICGLEEAAKAGDLNSTAKPTPTPQET